MCFSKNNDSVAGIFDHQRKPLQMLESSEIALENWNATVAHNCIAAVGLMMPTLSVSLPSFHELEQNLKFSNRQNKYTVK